MQLILLIFIGSGLGGICRYTVSNTAYRLFGQNFPYGTLLVNLSGSFLMGFLFALLVERFDGAGLALRAFLLVGFLGGFTTFSAFSLETINLFESGAWSNALLNILINVIFCIILAWFGFIGGKQL